MSDYRGVGYRGFTVHLIAKYSIYLFYSPNTGVTPCNCVSSPSSNCPPTSTAVIIAVTVVNILILLVSITLLVIGGVLIVKRRRHPPTLHYDKESKKTERIYDEVDDKAVTKGRYAHTNAYQGLDANKIEGEHVYTLAKN